MPLKAPTPISDASAFKATCSYCSFEALDAYIGGRDGIQGSDARMDAINREHRTYSSLLTNGPCTKKLNIQYLPTRES